MYNPASPTSGDYQQESLGKINQILYDSQNGTKPLATTGSATAEVLAEATASAPSYSEGQNAPLSQDLSGNLRVITGSASATRVNSAAYEASHILKASAGKLIHVRGYNSKGSAQFIQLHDSATLPADAAVPISFITVPANSNFSIDIPITGESYAAGIVICNSSTGPAKTIGSADCWFTGDVI